MPGACPPSMTSASLSTSSAGSSLSLAGLDQCGMEGLICVPGFRILTKGLWFLAFGDVGFT